MSLFPKYHELICDTYTPAFTAGTTQAALGSSDFTKSRASEIFGGQGLLFRSIDTLESYPANSIRIGIVVTNAGTVGDVTTYDVVVTITDGFGSTTVHNFTQKIDDDGVNPATCAEDGMVQLHAIVDPLLFMEMPVRDKQTDVDGAEWFAPLHERVCIVPNFVATFLTGAAGSLPNPPSVRTGPSFTLHHVNFSESENIVGDIELINKVIEWDGTQWIDHPSTLYSPDNPPPCP